MHASNLIWEQIFQMRYCTVTFESFSIGWWQTSGAELPVRPVRPVRNFQVACLLVNIFNAMIFSNIIQLSTYIHPPLTDPFKF